MRSSTSNNPGQPISYYVEHLDLLSFAARPYEGNLRTHLSYKYLDKPIGVVLSIGPGAFDFALKLRGALWPRVPIVFTAANAETMPRPLPAKTTGISVQKSFANMVTAARIIVPNLKRLVVVGNPFEGAVYYPHFASEIREFSKEFEIIDFMGLPVREIRQRVAVLPPDSAVFYLGINSDQDRKYASAVEALPLIAETTNRPIIGDAETEVGPGAVGGFVMSPGQIGHDAGRLVIRILDGEDASNIPVEMGSSLKPMFDWRQLKKWNISEAALPAGSEIRFRQPRIWEQHSAEILTVCAVLLIQAALIAWLVYEHRRRTWAELQSRNSMAELTYMNRQAAAGELSAAIAHEVNQPLSGITTRAAAALRWLAAKPPNIDRAQAALTQIVEAGHRAGDIVTSIRAMFRKETNERSAIDINNLILMVLAIVRLDLQKNSVELLTQLDDQLPSVEGNKVQLQQVILNLVMNAIEAMQSVQSRVLNVKSDQRNPKMVHISIEDTGTGIDPSNLKRVFSSLFTTKERGMGMGLSICHSIIESHNGRIWVSPGVNGGSIFQFELPPKSDQDEIGTMAA
jgi:signal transduction histidine kinase